MNNQLTVKEILGRTVDYFTRCGIANPRLDAEVLLADLLGIERIQLYVQFDKPLINSEVDKYRKRVLLRSKKVPVQYIIGHQEFMSLEFKVNKNVLIPRPETEHLVEAVIEFIKRNNIERPLIIDVGTGSGAIAVSLAYYLSEARVIGVDISLQALAVARENALNNQVASRIKFVHGSFLTPIKDARIQADVVVSNPPYIANSELKELQPEVRYEPQIALAGGEDGLNAYRQIISEMVDVIKPGGLVAFEVGIGQAEKVVEMLKAKSFEEITILPDFAGIDRVVLGIKK